MNGPNPIRIRRAMALMGFCLLGSGCGSEAPPSAPVSVAALSYHGPGPFSAAAFDVKKPVVPSAIEPKRVRLSLVDYGPRSAASADAALFRRGR